MLLIAGYLDISVNVSVENLRYSQWRPEAPGEPLSVRQGMLTVFFSCTFSLLGAGMLMPSQLSCLSAARLRLPP